MKALIIIDVQNDFLKDGALAIKNSNSIIPLINRLIPHFSHVVATQDWHPKNHVSFASTFNKQVGEIVDTPNGKQILWPPHCVQNSFGAKLSNDLDQNKIEHIVQKGVDPQIDSYSAFFDNVRLTTTSLYDYLVNHNIDELYFVGLATDYCVKYSVLDALLLNFKTFVIVDACRAINLKKDDEKLAIEEMQRAGANIILSKKILSS